MAHILFKYYLFILDYIIEYGPLRRNYIIKYVPHISTNL